MYDHYPDAETAASLAAPDPKDRAARPAPAVCATDGERLMRFRMHRDEAAFREVVEAHAVLVWGVCWQVLRHREDVEDVFQATFLILARKCAAIRATESAAGWLYRVAFRTALAARARRRRLGSEPLAVDPPASLEEQFASIERAEQVEALLEELHTLGDRYRQPLVLCYLEGRSRQEAADELGLTLASVKGRLSRGLRLLRTRLAYRGMALSGAATLLASEMASAQASIAAAPIAEVAATATSFAWAATATKAALAAESSTTTSPGAFLLAKQGIIAMKFAAIVKPVIGLLAVTATAGALALAAGDSAPGGGEGRTTTVVELVAGEGGDADAGDETPLAPNTFVATTDLVAAASPDQFDAVAVESQMSPAGAAPARAPSPLATTTALASVTDVLVAAPAASPADAALSAPAAFPTAGAISVTSAAPVAIRADSVDRNPSAPVAQIQAQEFALRVPPPAINPLSGMPTGSVKVMELERDHWQLKARGLQKKAEALQMKAELLANREDAADRAELAELEAEADLARAEVKLCEARAQQLKEAIELAPQRFELRGDVPAAIRQPVPPSPTGLPAPSAVATFPGPVPPTLAFAPATNVTSTPRWNGPDPAADMRPLKIGISASPSPARVGIPAVWEFKVENASNQRDENIELRIPTPDFLVVDPKAIGAPPNVKVRVENDVIVFSPLASLQTGQRVMYHVPFTPKRKGTFILRANAVSKNHPNGFEIAAPVWALDVDEALPSSTPGATLSHPAGPSLSLFAAAPQANVALSDSPRELLDLVSKLQKANEALERRLDELEGRHESPIK